MSKLICLLSLACGLRSAHAQFPDEYSRKMYHQRKQEYFAFLPTLKDPMAKAIGEKYLGQWLDQIYMRDTLFRSIFFHPLNASSAAVVTHSEFGSPENSQQFQAIKLYQKFKKLALPSKILVWDIWLFPFQYFEFRFLERIAMPSDIQTFEDVIIQGGPPKLVPRGKLFFGGGNFSACLCDTVRATVLTAVDNRQHLDLYFVRDAIYDLPIYYHAYFSKHNIDPKLDESISSFQWTDQAFPNDKDFLAMLSEHWVRDFGVPCIGKQDLRSYASNMGFDVQKFASYSNRVTYKITRDGRQVGVIGSGSIKVKLNFILFKDIDRYLN